MHANYIHLICIANSIFPDDNNQITAVCTVITGDKRIKLQYAPTSIENND